MDKETSFAQMKTERDAAVRDLEALMEAAGTEACDFCANCTDDGTMCKTCTPAWRGPQKEVLKK